MRSRPRERGVALVLVLWVFMLLGVLALDFAQYIRDDAMAAVNFADETRGYYAALAAMNLTLYAVLCANATAPAPQQPQQPVQQPTVNTEPECEMPVGETSGEFAGVRWSARVTDESSRIALNALNPNSPEDAAFLRYVIQNLMRGGNRTTGVDRRGQKGIDTVVDSILDWRDHDTKTVRPNGAESGYYRKRHPPYEAKNDDFNSLEELLKVRGVTPALYYGHDDMPGLRDVFSARPKAGLGPLQEKQVNVKRASPAVLLALLGDPDAVENLLPKDADPNLAGSNGNPVTAAVVKGLLLTNSGGAFNPDEYLSDSDQIHIATVEARADVASERNQARIAALVRISGGIATANVANVVILRWYDRAPWEGPYPGHAGASQETG